MNKSNNKKSKNTRKNTKQAVPKKIVMGKNKKDLLNKCCVFLNINISRWCIS